MTDSVNEQEAAQCKKHSKKFCFFSLILILAILGAIGFGYYHFCTTNTELRKMLAEQKKELATVQSGVSEIQTNFGSYQQNEQRMKELSGQQEKLISDWQSAQKGDLNRWSVAEAQYLVKLANDHLQFTHDTALALLLLQHAEQSLQNIQDPNLLELRKSITTAIADLQTQQQVDVTELYLKLNALNSQLDELPLPTTPLSADKTQNTLTTTNLPWWKAGLQHSVETLKQIVIVRKFDKKSSLPLVLPEEKIFLYQNLHAQMESAMWAVLHRNNSIYQANLKRAKVWVEQYFQQDAAMTKTVLEELAQLRAMNIQPNITNLAPTLKMFDDYFAKTKPAEVAPTTDTQAADTQPTPSQQQ